MTMRTPLLLLTGLCAALGACAAAPPSETPASAKAVGRRIDDILAANGPASRQWDLPDGRRAYQWQETSVVARVGAADANGEVTGAASQTTCFYTLYAMPDPAGRFRVVGYEVPRPGCMKFAMNSLVFR